MGWNVGRGCPLSINFFLVQCVQKIFVFRPKGWGIAQCPPLNTPLLFSTEKNKQNSRHCFNPHIYQPILIILGRNVPDRVCYQKKVLLTTSPN